MAETKKKGYWDFRTSDMGAYICCNRCGMKISAKEFIMAKRNWFECPGCEAEMNLSNLDYDLLLQEALNER